MPERNLSMFKVRDPTMPTYTVDNIRMGFQDVVNAPQIYDRLDELEPHHGFIYRVLEARRHWEDISETMWDEPYHIREYLPWWIYLLHLNRWRLSQQPADDDLRAEFIKSLEEWIVQFEELDPQPAEAKALARKDGTYFLEQYREGLKSLDPMIR